MLFISRATPSASWGLAAGGSLFSLESGTTVHTAGQSWEPCVASTAKAQHAERRVV